MMTSKKQLLVIAIAGCLTAITSCTGEYYVASQPADVVYARPVSPGPDYIWVDGDWVWSGNSYVWHQGYWSRPRMGRTWHKGYWQSGSRGYRWQRGRWR